MLNTLISQWIFKFILYGLIRSQTGCDGFAHVILSPSTKVIGIKFKYTGACVFDVLHGDTSSTLNITFDKDISEFQLYNSEEVHIHPKGRWICVRNTLPPPPIQGFRVNFTTKYIGRNEPVGECFVLKNNQTHCLDGELLETTSGTTQSSSTIPSMSTEQPMVSTGSSTATTEQFTSATTTTTPISTTTAQSPSASTTTQLISTTTEQSPSTITTTKPIATTTEQSPSTITTTTPISTTTEQFTSATTTTTPISTTTEQFTSATTTTTPIPTTTEQSPSATTTTKPISTTTEQSPSAKTTTKPISTTTEQSPSATTTTKPISTATEQFLSTKTSTEHITESEECLCKCPNSSTIITIVNHEQEFQDILKTLVVDKTSLSATRRKLTSAPDHRASSKGIGVIGVAFTALVIGLMVMVDLSNLIISREPTQMKFS